MAREALIIALVIVVAAGMLAADSIKAIARGIMTLAGKLA